MRQPAQSRSFRRPVAGGKLNRLSADPTETNSKEPGSDRRATDSAGHSIHQRPSTLLILMAIARTSYATSTKSMMTSAKAFSRSH